MPYADPTPVSSVTWTMAILVAMVVALIGWEVWVLVGNDTDGDTISEVTLWWAQRHPVVPFLIGVLMGHFFWTQQVAEPAEVEQQEEP